jgi:hypothetical protein
MDNSTTFEMEAACSNATHPFVDGKSRVYFRVLAGLYSVAFVVFVFVSLRNLLRRKAFFPVARARKPLLVVVSATGALVHLVVGPIREVVGRDVFPCVVFIPLWFLFLPLVCLPSLIRIFFYLNR